MKLTHSIPFLCLSLFIFFIDAHGQTIDDALIFSREEPGASARVKGLGNAQTALGGDISSLNGNPAGLGFFGRSDISITFNYLQNSNSIDYLGTNTASKKGNFGVDQVGAVFHFPTRSNSGWQNFNIGLSYNKTQNFNNSRNYEGNNTNSTMVHALTDIMATDEGFSEDFYNSFIVDQFSNPDDGYFPIAVENGDKMQFNEQSVRGNRAKTAVAFGANYNNKFYIGATLGITSFKYDRQTQFIENGWTKNAAEVAVDNPTSDFLNPANVEHDFLNASYELFDNFSQVTEGSGVDIKLGMIYKPAVDWNIGLTINTPTWTTIKEDTRAYTDINYYEDESSDNPFPDDMQYASDYYDSTNDYLLTSPWKFALGISKFFNRGLLAADVEFLDYSTMRYSDLSGDYYINGTFDDINNNIKEVYQSAINFRVGGEYLINNVLSGRAGFNYYGNPYKDADDKNLSGSLGLGIKLTNSVYLDMAVNHQFNSYKEAAYLLDEEFWDLDSPVANIDHRRTNVALTLGAKF
ncbi:hypothetical protein G5B30_07380 [Sphingobacterium sp. SGG-5]|uniref:OmpP1/FadL family transporter n=1 Tax=Sphingobacterium sp. SGG-5 TaxID=2710881 RepID=UPI0013EC6A9D|nr:hypothetical protein [Sphingobacterium sp. SGG-5]NGM61734.1 hypothetical protein [Sphingobacterium sp. SGG-5]